MNEFYILTFNNTHEAMQAESVCISEKVKVVMMPTPTYITKSCGISLKVGSEEEVRVIELINLEKIIYKTIYQMKDGKLKELTIT
ncbi:MAG: DUF3343 domain-containing protein [Terrisporobacter sp.]|uniref:DUF3343 domain-containing protein n=1 Tax=Clostridium sp. TaxID=1506 RepID=UPI00303C5DAD